jgi:hypothetical protein
MSISIGEIEATLRLVDQWSGPLRSAVEDTRASAATMGDALASMTERFDGRKLITEAATMQRAIDSVGGITKLTNKEILEAGNVMAEAAAKMRALGADVPPGFEKVAEAAKHIREQADENKKSHTELIGTLKEVAAAFGLAWSLERAVEFVKSIAEESRELQILSKNLGISTDDLQVLAHTTEQFNINTQEMDNALFALARRIASGDDSVATAYHMMGMSMDDVKKKDMMTLFKDTEHALGKLDGAIQDAAAADLFGGRLGNSLAALAGGFDDAYAKAKQMNIASAESVKALADYQAEISRAEKSLRSFATEGIGKVAQGFNVLTEAHSKGASVWQIASAMLKDFAGSSTLTGASASNLAKLLDDLNKKTETNTEQNKAAAKAEAELTSKMSDRRAALEFMTALERDNAKPLLDYQQQYMDHLEKIGELTAKNAAAIGVNSDQFNRYKRNLEEVKKAEAEEAAAVEATTKLWDEYFKLRAQKGTTTTEKAEAEIWAWYDTQVAAAQKAKRDTVEFYDALYAVAHEKLEGMKVDWSDLSKYTYDTLRDNYDRAQATLSEAMSGHARVTREGIEHFRELRDAARDALQGIKADSKDADDSLQHQNETVFGIALGFKQWNDAIMGVNASLDATKSKADAATAAADKLAQEQKILRQQGGQTQLQDLSTEQFRQAGGLTALRKIQDEIRLNPGRASGGSGSTGVLPGDIQGYEQMLAEQQLLQQLLNYAKAHHLPGFKSGVRNFAGGRALVGEDGPEIVSLPTGASVYPGGMSGGGTLNVEIHVNGMLDPRTVRELSESVGTALMKTVKSGRLLGST